jgi:four helix bundle protein
MEKKYLTLNDVNAYKISFGLSNYIWSKVIKWNYFEKDTVGKQFARAIDSISANLAEGFGRHEYKDKIKFYKYSRGSAFESLDWLLKSKCRKLINESEYEYIFQILKNLPKEINYLIKYTREKLNY